MIVIADLVAKELRGATAQGRRTQLSEIEKAYGNEVLARRAKRIHPWVWELRWRLWVVVVLASNRDMRERRGNHGLTAQSLAPILLKRGYAEYQDPVRGFPAAFACAAWLKRSKVPGEGDRWCADRFWRGAWKECDAQLEQSKVIKDAEAWFLKFLGKDNTGLPAIAAPGDFVDQAHRLLHVAAQILECLYGSGRRMPRRFLAEELQPVGPESLPKQLHERALAILKGAARSSRDASIDRIEDGLLDGPSLEPEEGRRLLERLERDRLLVLVGPAASGKKRRVRAMIEEIQRHGDDPVLALSLKARPRLETWRMVWLFLRRHARRQDRARQDDDEALDGSAGQRDGRMLADIRAWSRVTRAFVFLVGSGEAVRSPLERLVNDDGLRRLCQALHADGGGGVRVVVTSDRTDDRPRHLVGSVLDRSDHRLPCRPDPAFFREIVADAADLKVIADRVARSKDAEASCYLVAAVGHAHLQAYRARAARPAERQGCGLESWWGVREVLQDWWRGLMPGERALVAIVVGTDDPVRESTLRGMIADNGILGELVGDGLDAALETLRSGLSPILKCREIRDPAHDVPPDRSSVDRGFEVERSLKTVLWETIESEARAERMPAERRLPRLAQLAIARAARRAAYWQRLRGADGRYGERLHDLARDIQAAVSLCASIDLTASGEDGAAAPSSAGAETAVLTGSATPRAALRFARFQLIGLDIEDGDRYRLTTELHADELRLELMLSVIHPGKRFRLDATGHQELGLPGDLAKHLRGTFSTEEVADLLTSIAISAHRSGWLEVVRWAQWQAERLEQDHGTRLARLMRVHTAWLSSGMLYAWQRLDRFRDAADALLERLGAAGEADGREHVRLRLARAEIDMMIGDRSDRAHGLARTERGFREALDLERTLRSIRGGDTQWPMVAGVGGRRWVGFLTARALAHARGSASSAEVIQALEDIDEARAEQRSNARRLTRHSAERAAVVLDEAMLALAEAEARRAAGAHGRAA
jgi:hypothetical protein